VRRLTQTFRPDIEGLRGLAILLVVFYHVGLPGFTGGYVGVDVFFVLSGFLITGLLVKEIEETGRLRLARFYGRRARRLLPALTLTVSVTCVASFLLLSPVEQTDILHSGLATVAYASNIYFARIATFYLHHASESNPFLHTWTLSVEEQFYLMWPLLVLLALKGGRRLLALAMLFIFISTLALAIWLTPFKQPWAFFLSPPRAWEFAAGGLCVLLVRETRFTGLLRWTGLAATIGAAFFFTRQTAYPGIAALLPVVGTVMVLHATEPERGVGRLLSCPPLRFIGRLSYSWYLWHWPMLVFAGSLLGVLSPRARGACLLLSFALAWLTYCTIENPIRLNQYLAKRPARSLAMAACLALFGFTGALVWRTALNRALASPQQRDLAYAATDRPEVYAAGCFQGFYDTAPHPCTFGEGKTVVLFGDSHAAQWFPALRALKDWRVITFLKGSCAAADVSYYNSTISRRYTECEEWRTRAIEEITALHPDAIVIGNSRFYVPVSVAPPTWETGMQRTLAKLVQSGAAVYLMRDIPGPQIPVTPCLSKAAWNKWQDPKKCEFERARGLPEDLHKAEQAAAANAGARYLDLTESICPEPQCAPRLHGQIIFDEGNYLTASFARSLSGIFEDALGAGDQRK
jgi:peptidoglycan/LPS O-acetylase OafA/YrhL